MEEDLKERDVTEFDKRMWEREIEPNEIIVSSFEPASVTVKGIRITPPIVKFLHVFVGQSYTKEIHFQNISNKQITLKVARPFSWSFDMTKASKTMHLPPGLKTVRRISFKCTRDCVSESSVPIIIEAQSLYIPIVVLKGVAKIESAPCEIDFGQMDLGSPYVARFLSVTNKGACSSRFAIDLGSNSLNLMANPKRARLPPFTSVVVKIEMAGHTPGNFMDEFWVKGPSPQRVAVKATILRPYLKILHPNTASDFTLVDFEVTSEHSTRVQTIEIANMSSTFSAFLIKAEVDSLIYTLEEAKNIAPEFRMFSISPTDGIISAFESRLFSITFSPSSLTPEAGWAHSYVAPADYLCFFRIIRVTTTSEEYVETDTDEGNTSTPCRLCVYGKSEKVTLDITPTELQFSGVQAYRKENKVLRISNQSEWLAFGFSYIKTAFVNVTPSKMMVKPMKSVEVLVTLNISSKGYREKFPIWFEMLTYDHTEAQPVIIKVGKKCVEVNVKDVSFKNVEAPTQGLPSEVSYQTELEAKRTLSTCVKQRKCSPEKPKSLVNVHCTHGEYVTSALIEPDPKIHEGLMSKKRNWRKYSKPFDQKLYLERSSSQIYVNKLLFEKSPCKNWNLATLQKLCLVCNRKLVTKTKPLISQSNIPLSIRAMDKIQIRPAILNFSRIPPHFKSTKILSIGNFNTFAITIAIKTKGDLEIGDENLVVPPLSVVQTALSFISQDLGRYHSHVEYTLNCFHSFQMQAMAEVQQRTLIMTPMSFDFDDCQSISRGSCFLRTAIKNPICCPTRFMWKVEQPELLRLEPTSGIVPPCGTLMCVLYYTPSFSAPLMSTGQLVVDRGPGLQFIIHLSKAKKTKIIPLISSLDLGYVALGLAQQETLLLFNMGLQDVPFNIQNQTPIEGVLLSPKNGIFRARSCGEIAIRLQIHDVRLIKFDIRIELQNGTIIECPVTGEVPYPEVEFEPSAIDFSHVPCYASTSALVTASNKSQSFTKLQFSTKDYSQFQVSKMPEFKESEIDSEGLMIPPLSDARFYINFQPEALASYKFVLPMVINHQFGPGLLSRPETLKNKWHFKSDESGSSLNSRVERMKNRIPENLPHIVISCSVDKSLITFSQYEFDFADGEDRSISGSAQYLVIKNVSDKTLSVRLKSQKESPFVVSCVNSISYSELPPKGERQVIIEFCPNSARLVTAYVKVYVKEYSLTRPYNTIKLNGRWSRNYLACFPSEIYFLPVPLGEEIEASVKVYATGQTYFDRLESEFRCPDSNARMVITYPEGNAIDPKSGSTIIPVHLKFSCKTVVSLASEVIFRTSNRSICSLTVYATADSCLLTCHAYLQEKGDSFGMIDLSGPRDFASLSSPLDFLDRSSSYGGSIFITKDEVTQDESRSIGSQLWGKFSRVKKDTDETDPARPYPLFPLDKDSSAYAIHMKNSVTAIEEWIYQEGFKWAFRLPVGPQWVVSDEFFRVYHCRPKSNIRHSVKSILDLITLLLGRDHFLDQRQYPLLRVDRVTHFHDMYKKMILILTQLGGCLSHVKPMFLLTYNDYLVNYERLSQTYPKFTFEAVPYHCRRLDKLTFRRLSLQCWVDVYIQVYKILYLSRVKFAPHQSSFSLVHSASDHSDYFQLKFSPQMESVTKLQKEDEIPEYILAEWLNSTYNNGRQTWHKTFESYPRPLVIKDLNKDVDDGVVVAVILLHYCPFLASELTGVFLQPKSLEQIYHNAIIVSSAFNMLKTGMIISPRMFATSNIIPMTILIAHLYQVLPSYIPAEVIRFKARLAYKASRHIIMCNTTSLPIGFSLKVFCDPNEMFTINPSRKFILLPNDKIDITVTFYSRSLYRSTAYILVSGNESVHEQVANQVFQLDGCPKDFCPKDTYILNFPINQPTHFNLKVSSPYQGTAMYDIHLSSTEPKPGSVNMTRWKDLRPNKIPRQIYICCDSISISDRNVAPGALPIVANCYTLDETTFWIIFTGSETGSFVIKINLVPREPAPVRIFPIPLPFGQCLSVPGGVMCHPTCPRIQQIYLPCRNVRQWSAVKAMFSLCLTSQEKIFWENNLETEIGFKLLKWSLSANKLFSPPNLDESLTTKLTYTLSWDNDLVDLNPTLVVDNIHCPDYMIIPVHVSPVVTEKIEFILKLTSDSKHDIRVYNITLDPQLKS